MTTEAAAAVMPLCLDRLAGLGHQALRALHDAGRCPDPDDFAGVAEGRILHPRYGDLLRLWRGKVFDHDGRGGGCNRLGIGSFEFRRYRFGARVARSVFRDREILLLDHDRTDNPVWVRRFHDEVVQVRPGLYLASSHFRIQGRLRYAAYFALSFG